MSMEEGIVVLSLFDGMSCGQIALKSIGIKVKQYYACEIDKYAIQVTQHNFPDTIQLGDVTKVFAKDLPKIDLIIGGSPCQGFSFAGKQLAFDDPRSKLFFEYVRLVKECNPDYFLLENVKMKKEFEIIISNYMGVAPIEINSALVSAQNRERLYWTNIFNEPYGLFGDMKCMIPQPKDKGIILRDILETDVADKYYISAKALERAFRKEYSAPKINPDKTGAMNTKNNSGQLSIDSGTTFISCDGKAPTQRGATGRSLDKKHNYQIINVEGKPKPNQNKAACFTAGGNSGGNHSDMDLICVQMVGRRIDENGTRKDDDKTIPAIQRLEIRADNKTGCIKSVQKDNLVMHIPEASKKGYIEVNPGECFDFENPKSETRRGRKTEDKSNCLMAKETDFMQYTMDGKIRRLTPTECKRLQTIPDWYDMTVLSGTQIYRCLGNGWTVDVISHILSFVDFNTPK